MIRNLPDGHILQVGDVVRYWFDTGAFGCQILGGVIIKSGPKTFTVLWESGNRNTARHDSPRGIEAEIDVEIARDIISKMKRRGLWP